MEHQDGLPKDFDIEDATGHVPRRVDSPSTIDLSQASSTGFSIEELPGHGGRDAHTNNTIRLIEAKTRLYIACTVLGILVLLVIGGFIAYFLRDNSTILLFILGLIEGVAGAALGYFLKSEKKAVS